MVANPTPVPSNVPRPQQIPSTGSAPSSTPVPSNNTGGVRIKTEPGSYDTSGIPHSNVITGSYGNTIAKQRAAQNLHEKFGPSANLQINQLQGLGNPSQQPHRNPQNIQLPHQQSEQQRREYAERQRQQTQQQYESARQAQAQQQRSNVGNAQTDGADDWSTMVLQRRGDALDNPASMYDADMTMRERLEQMSHSMEGGGVMMPLSERPKQPLARKRKPTHEIPSSSLHQSLVATQYASPSDTSHQSLAPAQHARPLRIPQYDGLDDDEDDDDKAGIKDDPDLNDDDDEDAINSDLDDPDDDNIIEEEGEDGKEGQIMLCTYDKVQRVKNKWKCTLKDGVLTTGGKE